jgi:hypothetical protein
MQSVINHCSLFSVSSFLQPFYMLYVEVYKVAYTLSLSEPKNLVTSMFMEKSCLIVLLHYVCWSFSTFLCQFMRDCVSATAESSANCFNTVPLLYNDAEPDHRLNSFIAWLVQLAVKYWFQRWLTGLNQEWSSVCSLWTFQGESKVLGTVVEGRSQDCT